MRPPQLLTNVNFKRSDVSVFKLPSPPSANNSYINVPGRGRIVSNRLRKWRQAAGWEILLQKEKGAPDLSYPVEIKIFVQKEGNRRADADNLAKPVCDVLKTCGIIKDDSSKFVRRVSVEWVPKGAGCACRVEICSA